jgi:hypothetical protein
MSVGSWQMISGTGSLRTDSTTVAGAAALTSGTRTMTINDATNNHHVHHNNHHNLHQQQQTHQCNNFYNNINNAVNLTAPTTNIANQLSQDSSCTTVDDDIFTSIYNNDTTLQ